MRILQQIHHGREPRIPVLHDTCAVFAVPRVRPVWGRALFGRVVSGPGPHFYSHMDSTWIVVGLAGWALALAFVLLLMRMAGEQDRAARRSEKRLDPFSDVTITRIDKSEFTTACGGGSANEAASGGGSRGLPVPNGNTGTPKDPR